MCRLGLTIALVFAVHSLAVPATAHGKTTVKIATTFPKGSPWGKALRKMAHVVEKKSNFAVEIKIHYNGAQGDEAAMVAKMRRGRLDCVAVTSVGMSKIYKGSQILELPGLVQDWRTLDKVRKVLRRTIKKRMKAVDLFLLAEFDVGLVRYMSKGKGITTPADLKGMRVFRWTDDPVAPTTEAVLGFKGVRGSLQSLRARLKTGKVNVIAMSALLATSFKWTKHLDHIVNQPIGVQVGGIVCRGGTLKRLSADQRKVFKRYARKAGRRLTKLIRRRDARAYARLKRTRTSVDLAPAWSGKFKKVRAKLKRTRTFDPALITKAEALAGK